MVALPSDVARGDERVKGAFETVFKAMVTVLGREVRNTSQESENAAMARIIGPSLPEVPEPALVGIDRQQSRLCS